MAFPKVKTHTFRGRKFSMVWRAPKRDGKCPKDEDYFGECDWDKRTIKVFPSKDPMELLDTVLEEATHACFYDIEDPAVREYVADVRRLLVRMGIQIEFKKR